MVKFANPTTNDLFAPTEERVAEVATGKPAKGAFANPALPDLGIKEKQAILGDDFKGGTLKIGPFDTDIPISPRANQFLTGVGRSFANTGRAAKQLTGNFSRKQADEAAAMDAPLMETGAGMSGDIFGSAMQTAPLAVGTASGALGQLFKAAGATRWAPAVSQSLVTDAALTGAGMSQMRPMGTDESRLEQAALGAVGGIAGHALIKPASAIAGKVINTIRNKWADPAAQRIDELGRKFGVDLSVGDASNSPAWRTFEDMSKDVPGTVRKQNMERQAGQIQDMLHSLREDMRPDLAIPGGAGALYETPEAMMVGEIKRNHSELIKQKDALFDHVNTVIANNPQAGKVDLSNTEKAVQDLLADYPSIFRNFQDVDAPLVNKVTGLAGDLGELGRSKTTGKFAKKADYNEAQWLRKRLGALSAQAEKQSKSGSVGAVTDDAAGKLKQVYKAVNQDLDAWGANTKNKEIHSAYKDAQDFYKENIVPFKQDPTLRKVVDEFKPLDEDTAAKLFFKEGRGNLAKSVMRFQTPEGKAASQFVIIDDLINQGLDANSPAGLNVTKYLTKAKKLDVPAREVFDPAVQRHMDEVEEVLRAANRSEDYMVSNPGFGRNMAMRGVQSLPYLTAGGGAAALAMGAGGLPVAAGLGGLWALTRGLNSMGSNSLGKRMIMSSNKLPGRLQGLSEFTSTRIGAPSILDRLHEGGEYSGLDDQ